MNNRRRLALGLGTGVLAAPMTLFAQRPSKVWRIGFLGLRRTAMLDTDPYYAPFRKGMRELGYVEGKNLNIEWRSADGDASRLAGFAAELVGLKVDLLLTASTPATIAAKNAATTIPIVMGAVGDPVATGIVKSLSRPGGNVTGSSTLATDLVAKWLEMLLAMAPKLALVAVLVNPANPTHAQILKRLQDSAQVLGVKLLPLEARGLPEIEKSFATIASQKAGAIVALEDALFVTHMRPVADMAARNRLMSMYATKDFAEVGGLMSYGANLNDQFYRAAAFVDKIFKGASPADLPVEQPTKFDFVINGKTAKALGLTIPQSLLISADKVIE